MTRREIIELLDGTHSSQTKWLTIVHHGLILLAALAIAVATVPNLPPPMREWIEIFDTVMLTVFAAEYVLRIVCADHKLRYIFSIWGVIDLLACLPLFIVINQQWAVLRAMRLIRLVWVLKLLHANHALIRLGSALRQSRGELLIFAVLSVIILYIASVGIYIFEHEAQPEVFSSVPASLWWAVVSFTTVGYGDMYPITAGGRLFTALVLFVGLGVIAVPTAIITSALIHTNLTGRVEADVSDSVRSNVEKDLQKELSPLLRKPRRPD